MLSLSEAAPIAEDFLRTEAPVGDVELVITGAELNDRGWQFGYQSRRFVESGAMADMLGGNAPVRVDMEGQPSFVPFSDLLP